MDKVSILQNARFNDENIHCWNNELNFVKCNFHAVKPEREWKTLAPWAMSMSTEIWSTLRMAQTWKNMFESKNISVWIFPVVSRMFLHVIRCSANMDKVLLIISTWIRWRISGNSKKTVQFNAPDTHFFLLFFLFYFQSSFFSAVQVRGMSEMKDDK